MLASVGSSAGASKNHRKHHRTWIAGSSSRPAESNQSSSMGLHPERPVI